MRVSSAWLTCWRPRNRCQIGAYFQAICLYVVRISSRLRARGLHAVGPMAKIRLVVAMGALVWTTGCYHQETTVDTLFPEPTVVAGPPGGQMDPQWQEAAPGYNGYADPSGSPDGYATADGDPSGTYAVTGELEASADPQAAGYVMGEVTDEQIDQTLDGYGYWEET